MASHNTELSTVCDVKKQKNHLWSFVASGESMKDLFKRQPSQQPKLAQLDKALCKWFMTMPSTTNSINGLMKIEKAKSFYDKKKLTAKCTFTDGHDNTGGTVPG